MLKPSDNKSKKELQRYAGLATYLLVALSLGFFIGGKLDRWLQFQIPLLIWIFPLLMLFAIFYKIYKDTSKK
ncbi:MAG: AtpZ/AtpI family protein [Chitinophagaceae bacterium]|nr:MAG: AtpZ/AtpI family protein [Chitinophagaceae bacterium]